MLNKELIKVVINEEEINELVLQQINHKLSNLDTSKVFYTMEDLEDITGFSKTHIKNTFFDDYRFVKIRHKVGRKWVFQAEETRKFLRTWIKEMPNE